MHTKIAIIGSGPAGYTAAIYAARSGLSPVMIMGELAGGQLLYTHKIENFPSVQNISGIDLIASFQSQIEYLGVQTIYEKVIRVDFSQKPFLLELSNKENLIADSVIIATGASPKWLNVDGEERFKGRGISVCATCDGFFYKDKQVAVIGGGNTALYEASFLATLAKKVIVINRDSVLNGEDNLRKQVLNNPKIEIKNDTLVVGFEGKNKLSSLMIKNIKMLEFENLGIDGAFVAIGQTPNTLLFKNQLELDMNGYILTDCKTRQTSIAGIFAAGDVQEQQFRQAIIACGAGAIAALSAEKYLLTLAL